MNMNKLHRFPHIIVRTFAQQVTQHVKTPPTNLEVSVLDGSREDSSRLVDLYNATFLKEEPMVQAAGITDLMELQMFVSTALQSQHSVLLKEKTSGEVVAAASGGPVTYNTPDQLRQYAERSMRDARSQRLVNLWASVVSEANLLDSLHVPAVWDVSFLATVPRMRRLGLARFLVAQQRRLATKLGYSAISLYCACPHTARLAQKLRCQTLVARPLESYRDPADQPWVSGKDQVEVFYCVLRPRGGHTPDWKDVTTQYPLPNVTTT